MNVRRRSVILSVVAALAITACGGGDDEPVADEPATTDQPEGPPGTNEFGETLPTIAPDVPEEFLEGVGPASIVGNPLPAFPGDGVTDPAVGLTAPVLLGQATGGQRVRVDATVAGPLWVVFLAHWCPHCNDEIPVINEMRDDGRIPADVTVIGISTAYSPERPNWPPDEWLNEMGWTFPAINDGIDTENEAYIAASGFGIGGFPFSMLVDGDGTVTARWSGGRTAAELEQLLNDNLTSS